MAKLTAGDLAPAIDLPDENGKNVSLADFVGRRVVVYFYPKDDTPGCTVEGQEFSRLPDEFAGENTTVYGVSPDSVKSHEKFVSKCSLSVPLVSDPQRVLIDALGLWVEKHYMGRTYMGVERSTFLIGPHATIEREWRQVKAPGHAAEVLDAVRGGG